jgi:hypothetical protein
MNDVMLKAMTAPQVAINRNAASLIFSFKFMNKAMTVVLVQPSLFLLPQIHEDVGLDFF